MVRIVPWAVVGNQKSYAGCADHFPSPTTSAHEYQASRLRHTRAPCGRPTTFHTPLLSVRLKAVIQWRCIFGEAVQCFKAMLKLELMREAPCPIGTSKMKLGIGRSRENSGGLVLLEQA